MDGYFCLIDYITKYYINHVELISVSVTIRHSFYIASKTYFNVLASYV